MSKSFRLSESELKSMIAESVKRALNEGHVDSDVYYEWEQVREMVGDDTMLSELYHYMTSDQIEDFIYDHMNRNYDLGLGDNDNEMDDEY